MNSKTVTALFLLIVTLDVLFLSLDWPIHRAVSKSLIVPSLCILAYKSGLTSRWIYSALLFSWLGDLFLLQTGSLFFLLGLGAFLVGHLSYLGRLKDLDVKNGRFTYSVLVAILLFAFGYLYVIADYAGELFIPVVCYVFTIGSMAFFAIAQKKLIRFIVGALLFMTSDAILGLKTFGAIDFTGVSQTIISTYAIGQYFLIRGFVEFKNSRDSV